MVTFGSVVENPKPKDWVKLGKGGDKAPMSPPQRQQERNLRGLKRRSGRSHLIQEGGREIIRGTKQSFPQIP